MSVFVVEEVVVRMEFFPPSVAGYWVIYEDGHIQCMSAASSRLLSVLKSKDRTKKRQDCALYVIKEILRKLFPFVTHNGLRACQTWSIKHLLSFKLE